MREIEYISTSGLLLPHRHGLVGMKYMKTLFLGIFAFSLSFAQDFDKYFTNSTMRVDYYHIGTKGQEQITLDKVYEESTWPPVAE